MYFLRNKKGSVLIMSLIIMTGLLLVAMEFAVIVVSSIRQARNIDVSLIAFHAAESGAESALFQVRKKNLTTLDRETGNAGVASWDATMPDNFSPEVPAVTRAHLAKNETLEFALYKDDGKTAPNIQSMKITWTGQQCSAGEPWIDFARAPWTGGGSTFVWPTNPIQHFVKTPTAPGANEIITNAFTADPSIVRIKALYCDLDGVSVTFYSAPDAPLASQVPVPNYFSIRPVGSIADIKQAVKISLPRKAPLSGLYDYVLFSEDVVDKQ